MSGHKNLTVAFYVYILRCRDGSYYTGHTDDLEKRVAAHQQGVISGYTSVRRPVHLVFSESFAAREEAFERKRQIKGWTRQKKEALIQRDWNRLIHLSEA
jgi:predicted GIY-YIG superfamily endonuclease